VLDRLERLGERVLGEGRTGLGPRLVRRHVVEAEQLDVPAEDAAQLLDLAGLRVASTTRGRLTSWPHRRRACGAAAATAPRLQRRQVGGAGQREVEQRVQLGAAERAHPRRCPGTSMSSPSPVATTFMSVPADTSSG
jgi:hypothetical protein